MNQDIITRELAQELAERLYKALNGDESEMKTLNPVLDIFVHYSNKYGKDQFDRSDKD